jgi:hypothetical protein
MEHQSVFYLSHNLMYKNNKTIDNIKLLDKSLLPNDLNTKTNQEIYNYLNQDYINITTNKNNNKNKLQISPSNTLAYKILYVAFRLRVAFEGRIRRKDICNLHIPYKSVKQILSPNEQYNEYLYMFNKYSSIKVKTRKNYYSRFKQLVDITLTVMKNYE